MIVKIVDSPAVPGGHKAVVLCDDDGNLLPMQVGCTLRNYVGDVPTIEVTFHIDGKTVRFE